MVGVIQETGQRAPASSPPRPGRAVRLLSASAVLLVSTNAVAQEVEIVVTGRGLAPAQGDDVYDVATIGRERLEHSPSNRLEDILRDVAGFQQFRRSDSRSANPTSQGVTLRALGGNASSRALVLLDGVPQSDPFGGWISWPAYDPRRLGRIRLVRGGGTGSDGPGALSGAIALESAGIDEIEGLSAGIAYGSRDSIEGHASYGGTLGGAFVSVFAGHSRGDGFVPIINGQSGAADRPSRYRQSSLAIRAVTQLSASTELQASMSGFSDERERGTAFSEISIRGADASLRLVGRGALPFSALAYVQLRDFANRFAAVGANRAASMLTLDQHSVPATGLGARFEIRPVTGAFELRLGADWRQTEGRTHELYQFVAGSPTRSRDAGGTTRTLGAFAEAGWEHGPFTLTAGARIDWWHIADGNVRERVLATGALLTNNAFADRSGAEPTARAAFAWRVVPALTVRTAAYLGWRLPTLNELYRPFRVGADATAANAGLAPERLNGAEVGLDWRPAPWARIGVTLFANRLTDPIANVTIGQGPGVFPGVGFVAAGGQVRMRQNIDAVESKGVEVDFSLRLGPFRFAGGYSFADSEVEASGAAFPLDGLRPAQTPRHSVTSTLSWQGPGNAYASVSARYSSGQYEDDFNRQRLPGALTLDAVLSVPVGTHLAIDLRGENLSNERVVAAISSAGIIERATPRTLWVGFSWRG